MLRSCTLLLQNFMLSSVTGSNNWNIIFHSKLGHSFVTNAIVEKWMPCPLAIYTKKTFLLIPWARLGQCDQVLVSQELVGVSGYSFSPFGLQGKCFEVQYIPKVHWIPKVSESLLTHSGLFCDTAVNFCAFWGLKADSVT